MSTGQRRGTCLSYCQHQPLTEGFVYVRSESFDWLDSGESEVDFGALSYPQQGRSYLRVLLRHGGGARSPHKASYTLREAALREQQWQWRAQEAEVGLSPGIPPAALASVGSRLLSLTKGSHIALRPRFFIL